MENVDDDYTDNVNDMNDNGDDNDDDDDDENDDNDDDDHYYYNPNPFTRIILQWIENNGQKLYQNIQFGIGFMQRI